MKYPTTQSIRFLRENRASFEPHVFEYIENGGTAHSANILGVDEHSVIKTLIFETNENSPFIVLMHGDLIASTKQIARHLSVKSVSPVSPEIAFKLTGFQVGGISPFGTKTKLPIYAEESIFNLKRILINGGKRGFLIAVSPVILTELLSVERVRIGIRK